MEQQYCCCIERRLGCLIVGFVVIIETFLALPVHTAWDTVSNTILGVISGTALIVGVYQSNKSFVLAYLGVQVVQCTALLVASISTFVDSSRYFEMPFCLNHASQSGLEVLGWMYIIFFIVIRIFGCVFISCTEYSTSILIFQAYSVLPQITSEVKKDFSYM